MAGADLNQRDTRTAFQQVYESVLRRHVPEYDHLVHTRINYRTIAEFFDESSFEANPLLNRQILKLEGLIRRVESSSYVPSPDQPAFTAIVDEVTTLFYDNQTDGTVNVDYETRLFIGQMSRA